MNLQRRILYGSCRSFLRCIVRHCQHAAADTSAITKYPKPTIPCRIERGPTDILRALANTVSDDPTAPGYQFHDDPYLYPFSTMENRQYALSKESGKRAAKWIRDTHSEYFNNQSDDPVIKNLIPKSQINEEEITENDLLQTIDTFQVSEAIKAYELCCSKGLEISDDTKQSLLELLCFYNSSDTLDPDWTEERLQQSIKSSKIVKSWKDGCLAETLFEQLKENGAKPYCAIIRGMSAYYQVERAWQLYQEALDKHLLLDTQTFNSVIRLTPASRSRWDAVKQILHTMTHLNVPPNLGTLNGVLECLSMMRGWNESRTKSLQALSEFKQFGVKPCLTTYYYLLRIFYPNPMSRSPILASILDDIELTTPTVQDPRDTMFLFNAMEICMENLQNLELAERLNRFIRNGDNIKFLGERIKRIKYFDYYLILAVNSMPAEEFMEIYDRLVPFSYSPTSDVLTDIIQNLGVQEKLNFLPTIWSDCQQLKKHNEQKLMEMILLVINKHNWQATDAELATALGKAAWDIWILVEGQKQGRREMVEWNGLMLGDCISALVKSEAVNRAYEIFVNTKDRTDDIGVLPSETLKILFDTLLKRKAFANALTVAKYAKEHHCPEAAEMALQMGKESTLPEATKASLIKSFGSDCVTQAEASQAPQPQS